MKGYKESDYVGNDGSYTDKGLWLAAQGMGLFISILKCDTATANRPMMYDPSAQELTDFTRHLQKRKNAQTKWKDLKPEGYQEFFAIESKGHWTLLAATHQLGGKLEYAYVDSKKGGEEQLSSEFLQAMQAVYGEKNIPRKDTPHKVQQEEDKNSAIHVILNARAVLFEELDGQDHSVENIQKLDAYYKGYCKEDSTIYAKRVSGFAADLKAGYNKDSLGVEIKTKIVVGYHKDNHTAADEAVVNYINSDDKKPAQELDIPALIKLSKHMMARGLDQQIAGMSQEEAQRYDRFHHSNSTLLYANHIPEPTAYSGLGLEAEFVDGNGVKGFKVTAIKEGADEKLKDLVGKTITHYTVDGVKYPITSEEDYVHIRNAAFEYGKLSLTVQGGKEIRDIKSSLFHGEKGKGKFSFKDAVQERLNREVTKAGQGLSGAGLPSSEGKSDEVPADRFRRKHVDRQERDMRARLYRGESGGHNIHTR